jgi:hypothetical protein
MKVMSRGQVEAVRKMYPRGTRVELVSLEDPYSRLPQGMRGTVDAVDDIGTIHVRWDNGSRLGIVYGVDSIRIVTEVSGVLKEQILQVRDTGLVNMFDVRGVKEIAEAMELAELVRFLDEDRKGYTEFILYGGRKPEG